MIAEEPPLDTMLLAQIGVYECGNLDLISDGRHTFGELYEHRAALLIALMSARPDLSWFAEYHDNDAPLGDFFIAGMRLPTGDISYHLRRTPWFMILANDTTVPRRLRAPAYDGHASRDVIARLVQWAAPSTRFVEGRLVDSTTASLKKRGVRDERS